ncbi:MAG TPA: hypothetical protein VEA44_14560 [Caulobacter sp.]|nr:hypothetical protein [Caulobacter sp.]
MRRIIAALLFSLLGLASAAAAPRDAEPKVIVAEVYAALVKEQGRPTDDMGPGYNPPDDIYAPALAKAFKDEDADRGDEIGRLDFFYWVNGQDWELTGIEIEERTVWRRPDRRVVTVAFQNFGEENLLAFYFQKIGGRWLIDDVESIDVVEGEGGSDWTLSLILKYAREEE